MSGIRKLGVTYPFEVRLRAREHHLRGLSYKQISEAMLKEDQERAASEGGDASTVKAVPPSVIGSWADKGSWEAHRGVVQRQAERQQLERVRRDFAVEASHNTRTIGMLQGFLQRYFVKPRRDGAGNVVTDASGRPVMEPRTPEDWPMKPEQVVALMLALVDKRNSNLRLMSELLGEYVPKVDPDNLLVKSS